MIETFSANFSGQLVPPDHADYDDARKIWNADIDRRPGLIARCRGTADVIDAIRFARNNDVVAVVRGGGHNVGGRAVCDDGLVIDLSLMRGVYVDPAHRTVRAQGGALLGDVDRETHLHGLAVPFGVVSKTGIGGLTLGGGVGWLTRKYGLTCDNVLSFEVVTAEGTVLTADATNHADLFWALRGGGGNFGVVTSFLYRAHPVSTVFGGMVLHARADASAVLRHYREFMKSAPDELTVYGGLITLPDGTPAAGLLLCYCGDPASGERIVKPLRDFGNPIADTLQAMPLPAMQKAIDELGPPRASFYWKSSFVTQFSDDLIDVLIEHAGQAGSPLSSIVIECFGGAANRIAPTATAFAHRNVAYNIQISAQWTDRGERDRHIDWARTGGQKLGPFSSGAALLNYVGIGQASEIEAAFGTNLQRLKDLKQKYDPHHFFQPVRM
ncbi:FAD-binding oxidoreductase [Paraburkholderia jirisanensis]